MLSPTILEIRRAGRIAAGHLTCNDHGVVIARFRHSLYLDLDGHPICVGTAQIGDGPLNCHTAALPDIAEVGAIPTADARHASIWSPPEWPRPFNPSPESIDSLRKQAIERAPQTGLARVALDWSAQPSSPEEQAAFASIGRLRHGDVDVLAALLGLGTGLTPAGDDVILGYMLARQAIGESLDPADLLATAAERTNAISLAHLEAASRGCAAAPLHALLSSLQHRRDAPSPHLDELARIGHSSGFDALGGALLALGYTVQETEKS